MSGFQGVVTAVSYTHLDVYKRQAVHKRARGLGVGGQLLDALIGQGHGDGHRMLVLHAQTHAKGFYEAHGFQVEGEEFMEAGIAHVVMTRVLA